MLHLRPVNRFILTSLALIGLSLPGATLQASIVVNFDISDTSWATSVTSPTFATGDSLNVAFFDGTDFGSLQSSDLESITINLLSIGVNHTFIAAGLGKVGFDDIFSYDGSQVMITVGAGPNATIWDPNGTDDFSFQLGRGSSVSLIAGGPAGILAANSSTVSHTYNGVFVSAVPVPAAAWLFGTALIGLLGFGNRGKRPGSAPNRLLGPANYRTEGAELN